jgi:hypothetical protein
MLDRPPLSDARIAAALRDRYGIETTTLEFLALGHNANAWTFRGRGGSRDVFVKIRRAIDPAPAPRGSLPPLLLPRPRVTPA